MMDRKIAKIAAASALAFTACTQAQASSCPLKLEVRTATAVKCAYVVVADTARARMGGQDLFNLPAAVIVEIFAVSTPWIGGVAKSSFKSENKTGRITLHAPKGSEDYIRAGHGIHIWNATAASHRWGPIDDKSITYVVELEKRGIGEGSSQFGANLVLVMRAPEHPYIEAQAQSLVQMALASMKIEVDRRLAEEQARRDAASAREPTPNDRPYHLQPVL
jgi:hypothetical protein